MQNIINTTQAPVIIAAILGFISSMAPCPLATNISAVSFISKDIQSKREIFINGLAYMVGHTLSYALLGIALVFLLEQGAAIFRIQRVMSIYGELLVGPLMIIIGIFMLDLVKIDLFWPGKWFGNKITSGGRVRGWHGAMLLGVLFALAFCPYNGVIFFGGLIPLAVSSPQGYLLPIVFALATSIPVITFAWVVAFSISKLARTYNLVKNFEFWARRVAAIIFILAGLFTCFKLLA